MLYWTTLSDRENTELQIDELRGHAVTMANGKTVGTLDRRTKQHTLAIALPRWQAVNVIKLRNRTNIEH